MSAAHAGERLVVAEAHHRPDAVGLFLFSAATGLAHRIHYDESFARSEGLAGLPVHGPLQAAWLSGLVEDWARRQHGSLTAMTVRHRSPLLAGEQADCAVVEVGRRDTPDGGVDVELDCSVRVGERTCTEGAARVAIPPHAVAT